MIREVGIAFDAFWATKHRWSKEAGLPGPLIAKGLATMACGVS
jgi:hypothetical protein